MTAGLATAAAAAAQSTPAVHTSRGCYLVGQRVDITGSGFAVSRSFDVTVDGVDFGRSTTDSHGGFTTSLVPGGLPADVAQHIEHLEATDGSSSARTRFTLTRPTGGRFLASRGNPHSLTAPFEAWAFSTDGVRRTIYIHYVSPAGHVHTTVRLGVTHGQCGDLRTPSRRVFPFSPSRGAWTLQLDTHRVWFRHPGGAVARIRVLVH